jgi:hypothetical protein
MDNLIIGSAVGILIEDNTIASIKAALGRIIVTTITITISNPCCSTRDSAVGILIENITITSIKAALGCVIVTANTITISNP